MIKDLFQSTDLSSVHKTPLSGRYVYFIVDALDAVIYVGQTCSPALRLTSHKGNADFNYIKMVAVSDGIDLCDAEFMEILRHKPIHNKEFSTPTFLTTKTRILSDGDELLYDMHNPSCKLTINGKERCFWLKSHMVGRYVYELLIDDINLVEALHCNNKLPSNLVIGHGGITGESTATKGDEVLECLQSKQSDDWNEGKS